MQHETCMALDIGEKRIGVAVGSIIPFGRGAVDATNTPQALALIKKIVEDEKVERIIVGVPHVRSGDITTSQQNAFDWIKRLKQETSLPVENVDESYSSQEAENQLRSARIDVKNEKWRIDERAAELILAQYLNEKKL